MGKDAVLLGHNGQEKPGGLRVKGRLANCVPNQIQFVTPTHFIGEHRSDSQPLWFFPLRYGWRWPTVNIVHDTFRLFITSSDESRSEFFVNVHESHAVIAKSCLSYLSKEVVKQHDEIYLHEKLRIQLRCDHPLFSYSSQYWSAHIKETHFGTLDDIRALRDALSGFLTADNIFIWLRSLFTYAVHSAPYRIPIPGVLLDIGHWLREKGLGLRPKPRMASTEDYLVEKYQRSDFHELCHTFINAAAKLWLTVDPKY